MLSQREKSQFENKADSSATRIRTLSVSSSCVAVGKTKTCKMQETSVCPTGFL